MPRGSGKSALCKWAALWALLYGHRRFVLFIGAESDSAAEGIAEVMEELETNEDLDDDFNEVTRYVRALEGIGQRAKGQTCNGVRTRIEWGEKIVRFPSTPGSVSAGSVMRGAGLTGRLRGMTVAGKRPDLVILDDPQTDESAASFVQIRTRERIVSKAILGLAGPKTQIAALMPITVIFPGDMADRVLDRERHPYWQGERMKMVYNFPTNTKLWSEYAQIQRDGFADGDKGAAATAFYLANRRAMDAGAVLAWPERFPDEKVSGIQHAMDLLIDDRAAFMAECQNQPEVELLEGEVCQLDADAIAAKVNKVPRGVVPRDCNRLTVGIDVQGGAHFAVITAWDSTFGGSVVDYLTYPKQTRTFYTNADARPSLADIFRGQGEDARVYLGLKALCELILSRSYPREGGGEERVAAVLIDSGKWTDTVYQFCAKTPFKDVCQLRPSKGIGIRAGNKPMSEYRAVDPRRDLVGRGWRAEADAKGRHVLVDTNLWKTFVAERLAAELPNTGCLVLNGSDRREHELFAAHLTAEYQVETSGYGRTLREWNHRPERFDNHYWDALVLSAVAASFNGLSWDPAAAAGDSTAGPRPRLKIKLSDLQKQRREEKRARS
jgi:hypothetical protein